METKQATFHKPQFSYFEKVTIGYTILEPTLPPNVKHSKCNALIDTGTTRDA